MGTYVKRLEEVEAIRAGDNLEEIRALAGAEVDYYLKLETPYYVVQGVVRVLWVGNWLVKHNDGWLQVLSDDEFRRIYEPKG